MELNIGDIVQYNIIARVLRGRGTCRIEEFIQVRSRRELGLPYIGISVRQEGSIIVMVTPIRPDGSDGAEMALDPCEVEFAPLGSDYFTLYRSIHVITKVAGMKIRVTCQGSEFQGREGKAVVLRYGDPDTLHVTLEPDGRVTRLYSDQVEVRDTPVPADLATGYSDLDGRGVNGFDLVIDSHGTIYLIEWDKRYGEWKLVRQAGPYRFQGLRQLKEMKIIEPVAEEAG